MLATPLVATHLGLLVVFRLAEHLYLTLWLVGIAFAALLGAWRRLRRHGEPVVGILLVAAILRILLLPLPPSLSDDALRYLWDGRVVAAGWNPYRLAPEADELRPLRDESWQRLPHRGIPTIYPPLAVGLFSIAASFPLPMGVLKASLAAADLVACWLLLRLARGMGIAAVRTIWYAWNPLVTLEVAASGHVDALAMPLVVATVYCLLRRPPRREPAALAAVGSVLVKLVPLLAIPMWARQGAACGRFALLAAGLLVVCFLPLLWTTGGVPPGMVVYGVSWEYNGPLFEPLWRLIDAFDLAPHIKKGLDSLKLWTGRHDLWNRFYPFVYPQLIAKLLLGVLALVLVVRSLSEQDPVAGTGRLFGGLLLCSATVYPWYLLWVLPWAALCRQTAWLSLSFLILLAYLPQWTGLSLVPWVYLAVWAPFFGLLAWRSAWSTA